MKVNDFIPGIHKDPPDPRDWIYSKLKAPVPLPPSFCWELTPQPPRNQGDWGTCGGHAAAQAKEIYTFHNRNKKVMRYSPRFVYTMAKKIDGTAGDGVSMRAVIKALCDYGICEERLMPYNIANKDLYPPPPEAIKQAELFRIAGYARCQTPEEIKQAVMQQGPVIFGLLITDTFINEAKNGIIPERYSGFLLGGHAMVIIGWDDIKKWYIVLGSWGANPPQTDAKGLHYIPYSYMHATIADFGDMPVLMDSWTIIQRQTAFTDIWGHWGQEAIEKAVEEGLLTGYPDGTFQPDKALTRAELASVLVRLNERSV